MKLKKKHITDLKIASNILTTCQNNVEIKFIEIEPNLNEISDKNLYNGLISTIIADGLIKQEELLYMHENGYKYFFEITDENEEKQYGDYYNFKDKLMSYIQYAKAINSLQKDILVRELEFVNNYVKPDGEEPLKQLSIEHIKTLMDGYDITDDIDVLNGVLEEYLAKEDYELAQYINDVIKSIS